MSGAKENACNPRRDKTSVTNTPNTINMLLTLFTYIAIFTCDGGRRLSAGHPGTCIFPVCLPVLKLSFVFVDFRHITILN